MANAVFTPPGDKFTIGTVDGELVQIVAQYNPKELGFQAQATWNKHANTNGGEKRDAAGSYKLLEYGDTDSRTLTAELTFDGHEQGESVEDVVAQLEALTAPQDMKSTDLTKRRPHLCVAIWGDARPFRCIVQSVTTKLSMFTSTGTPTRATCTVILKEVDVIGMLEADGGAAARVTSGESAARNRSTRGRLP